MKIIAPIVLPILVLLMLSGGVAGNVAWASGSGGNSGGGSSGGSGGSSGGSGGSSGGGGDYSPGTGNYAIGKSVFFEKLHCETCPLSGLELTSEAVAPLLPSLKSGGDLGKLLSYRQRYAVKYFLKKRFNL